MNQLYYCELTVDIYFFNFVSLIVVVAQKRHFLFQLCAIASCFERSVFPSYLE